MVTLGLSFVYRGWGGGTFFFLLRCGFSGGIVKVIYLVFFLVFRWFIGRMEGRGVCVMREGEWSLVSIYRCFFLRSFVYREDVFCFVLSRVDEGEGFSLRGAESKFCGVYLKL